MERMKIVGKRFEDEGWEDPSLGGWMLLYVLCQVFSIIISIRMITQFSGISGIVAGILSLMVVLPVYSVVALIFRLRNAVFDALAL